MDGYMFLWNGENITKRISSPTLKDNLKALSAELSFTYFHNPNDPLIGFHGLSPGGRVQMYNTGTGTEVFRGIVVSVGLNGAIVCNDFGFYLNKSRIIIQFNDAAVDDALRQLGGKCGVTIGRCPSIPTKVTDVYIDKKPADIIADLLERATAERGVKYGYRVEGAQLAVYEYPTAPIYPVHQLCAGATPYNPTWSMLAISGEASIDELRNQVIVYRDENEKTHQLAYAADGASIGKYGWLQHLEKADESTTAAQAAQIAQTKLRELNRVTEGYHVNNMLGADEVKSGVMLSFGSGKWGFEGKFIVTEVVHSYQPHHTMRLEVERA